MMSLIPRIKEAVNAEITRHWARGPYLKAEAPFVDVIEDLDYEFDERVIVEYESGARLYFYFIRNSKDECIGHIFLHGHLKDLHPRTAIYYFHEKDWSRAERFAGLKKQDYGYILEAPVDF